MSKTLPGLANARNVVLSRGVYCTCFTFPSTPLSTISSPKIPEAQVSHQDPNQKQITIERKHCSKMQATMISWSHKQTS
jgi:hypothetical protein